MGAWASRCGACSATFKPGDCPRSTFCPAGERGFWVAGAHPSPLLSDRSVFEHDCLPVGHVLLLGWSASSWRRCWWPILPSFDGPLIAVGQQNSTPSSHPWISPTRENGAGQLWTVILTGELYALPTELKASDNRAYEPLGTVAVFQLHNHPYSVSVAVQTTGALKP